MAHKFEARLESRDFKAVAPDTSAALAALSRHATVIAAVDSRAGVCDFAFDFGLFFETFGDLLYLSLKSCS